MARALAARVPTCINVSIDPAIVEPSMGIMLGGGAPDKKEGEPETQSETVVPYYENLTE
jgi:hypothetical protein